MKFEDRIKKSAQQIAAEQNASLHIPMNPHNGSKSYLGWVTTPAAAFAGIALGLSFQLLPEAPVTPVIAHVADTVFVPDVRHDTVWLTRVEEKERIVKKTVWRDREPDSSQAIDENTPYPVHARQEDTCTSVSCDGIDYAMLTSR